MKQTGETSASIDEQYSLSQEQKQQFHIPVFPPPPNLPRQDLLDVDGSRERYIKVGVPLYEAAIRGDWKAAKVFFDTNEELVRSSITENGETVLHIAASAKRTKQVEEFVENLVALMEVEDLALKNKNSNTALCLAAVAGNVKIVDIMVKKNRDLLAIPGSRNLMPLYLAALFGNHDMAKYLYDNSNKLCEDGWTPQSRGWLLQLCAESDMFDVALRILDDWPELTCREVLFVLARKPDAFVGTKSNIIQRIINSIIGLTVRVPAKECEALILLRHVWQNIAKKPKNEIDDIIRGPPDRSTTANKEKQQDAVQLLETISENIAKLPVILHNLLNRRADQTQQVEQANYGKQLYSSRVLFVATEMGNTEFVAELIRQYPDLIWKSNNNHKSIFHVAVLHRHVGIYNLIHEIGSMKDLITPLMDENGNNILHLVGKNAKTKRLGDVPGYALQMQRELLWFKEVESLIPPTLRRRRNKDGLTPHELFTKEHKDLLSAGEKWMKDTASQCMVVAALIATIVFAAAFTVPGGYNQDTGMPMFLHKRSFIVFVIADAISLTFSSISILIFLSIHIASYFEQDFLESLPKILMKGLTTLFLSIAAMMVAFSVSFFVLYQNNLIWVPITITIFTSIPVYLFGRLQFKLLADVYHSTYDSKNLFKPGKTKLYLQNPRY